MVGKDWSIPLYRVQEACDRVMQLMMAWRVFDCAEQLRATAGWVIAEVVVEIWMDWRDLVKAHLCMCNVVCVAS